MRKTGLILGLLLVLCFCMALGVERGLEQWSAGRPDKGNIVELLLGDSRRLFADYLFTRADIYFHSGFYLSRFESNPAKKSAPGEHVCDDPEHHHEHAHEEHEGGSEVPEGHENETAEEHAAHAGGDEREDHPTSKDEPRDWIERFGRAFYPATHTHLDQGGANGKSGGIREILPWLKMSADLDPSRIETYTVAAYWLDERLNRPEEAKAFLREGLRLNPGNPTMLFELGALAWKEKSVDEARRLWEVALSRWRELAAAENPAADEFLLERIYAHLAELERQAGNPQKAIEYLTPLQQLSPAPESIAKQIEELKGQIAPE